MGSIKGAFVALGVLLFVMVPLAGADEGKSLTTPPGQAEAEEALRQGQQGADDGANEAGRQADKAQGAAVSVKYEALDKADEASKTGSAAGNNLIETIHIAASLALATLGGILADPLPDDFTNPSPLGDDGAVESASSPNAAAVASQGLAATMVVAASALGGSLLWLLRRGLMLGFVPALSRIAHHEIYNNDARRLINQMAVENPGLCLNEIVAKTGYSRNAVSYHLFVLEKEQEIVSIKDGKYRRYFPRGGKYVNGAKNVVSALRNTTTLQMAQHVYATPGTIQRELCKLLGTTASAACWHAKRLEQLSVIRKERVANTVQYFPGEASRKYDLSEFGLRSPEVASAPAAEAPPMVSVAPMPTPLP